MKPTLDSSITFSCGAIMKNKFMLAPLTNSQSNEDGTLSQDEFKWLTMRAEGGFGLVMTCASHVNFLGKGFPGQLGIYSDTHIEGHTKLTREIKKHGSLAVIQLHHAGMRTPKELVNQAPLCPSDNKETGARAMSLDEVKNLKNDFVNAAVRAQKSGYDGVEIHGAHGYILSQFISKEINLRNDQYGGSLENRSRILFEIVSEVRKKCGKQFLLGVRLSPEKFGMDILEIKEICKRLITDDQIDFLDISLWDVNKFPEEERYSSKSLLDHVTELEYQNIKVTVAGKIYGSKSIAKVLEAGIDFVSIGKSGILHHDFPNKVMRNENFETISTPVSEEYLIQEGLGPKFIQYMKRWPDFVSK